MAPHRKERFVDRLIEDQESGSLGEEEFNVIEAHVKKFDSVGTNPERHDS